MAQAQADIEAALTALTFPPGVDEPEVGRFNPEQFPVIQFSVLSEQGPEAVAYLVQTSIVPQLEELDGVLQVQVSGEVERQIIVAVDPAALDSRGLAMAQVIQALEDNNLSLPSGLVFEAGRAMPVRSGHQLAFRGRTSAAFPLGPTRA